MFVLRWLRMDLKSVFSSITNRVNTKPNRAEIHLAVKISTTSVTATVWSVEGGKVVIGKVGFAPVKDSAGWEDFLKSVDTAISQTLKDNDSDAQKVIFAVPADWVTDGKIHPDHLKSLRHICKELDLVAVGYVDLTEALENFFKEVEGAPLTGILIGIDGDRTSLAMYRAGKNLGAFPVGSSGNSTEFPAAVEKALKRFADAEIFPSRFILYDGKSDLGPLAEKLTAYPWTKNLPFLHFPKVETITAEFVVKAVAVAAGMQMGGSIETELFSNEKFEYERPTPGNIPDVDVIPEESEPKESDDILSLKEDADSVENEGSLGESISNSGEDETIPEDAIERMDEEGNPVELEEVSAEDAGFIVDDPSGDLTFPIPQKREIPSSPSSGGLMEMPDPGSQVGGHKDKPLSPLARILKALPKRFSFPKIPNLTKLFDRSPKTESQFRSSSERRFNFIPLIIGALLIVAIISAVVFFVPKVDLILTLETKPFTHNLEVVISAQKEASASAKSISGSFIETSEVGTKKGVSTGSKLVGERAKGTVTIYGVSNSKTFVAGTTISSPDGLRFTLDRDASVASGDAVTPSTVSVPITAGDIGDKFNLSSGTKFTISGLSSSQYLGKNDTNLTGGSSHQATVVTKVDQDRLLAALTAELNEKAKTNLMEKVPDGTTLLPQAITNQVVKKTFSKDVDAEADTFSVDLTVSFKGVVFRKTDMTDLFLKTFPNDIPENYHLEDDPNLSVIATKLDKSNNPVLEMQINGKLLPKTDVDELKKKLSGKGKATVLKTVSLIPGFSKIQKETKPKFFDFVTDLALPWQTQNLSIEVVAQ
jgi:hypothetical protein